MKCHGCGKMFHPFFDNSAHLCVACYWGAYRSRMNMTTEQYQNDLRWAFFEAYGTNEPEPDVSV
jgi:hypothetical protein